MATATERARAFKAAQRERGLVQVNVWLPRRAAAEFKRAAELVATDPDLRIGRMGSESTGRVRGLS
jgi:hypothetical protein